jgi:hypothetical protein
VGDGLPAICRVVVVVKRCVCNVRTISTEATLPLKGLVIHTKVAYVCTLTTLQPLCKAFHESLSVQPNLKKKIDSINFIFPV